MTPTPPLVLRSVPGPVAVCRLGGDAPGTSSALSALLAGPAPLLSITRTPSEVSVVCPFEMAPADARVEGPWHVFAVDGVLAFTIVGVLVRLTTPLATAGISVFALSTYDTDYLLVPAARADDAVRAWLAAGLGVVDEDAAPG